MSEESGREGKRAYKMAGEKSFQEEMARAGALFYRMEGILDRYWSDDVVVRDIRVRMPELEGQEFLCIVSACAGGENVVAFTSASTFAEALAGSIRRLENGSIKWQKDRYRS